MILSWNLGFLSKWIVDLTSGSLTCCLAQHCADRMECNPRLCWLLKVVSPALQTHLIVLAGHWLQPEVVVPGNWLWGLAGSHLPDVWTPVCGQYVTLLHCRDIRRSSALSPWVVCTLVWWCHTLHFKWTQLKLKQLCWGWSKHTAESLVFTSSRAADRVPRKGENT